MGTVRRRQTRDVPQTESEKERTWPDEPDLEGPEELIRCAETLASREAPNHDQQTIIDLWPKEKDGSLMRVPAIKENDQCEFDALTGFLRCEFIRKEPPATDCRLVGCPYSALMRMRAINRARKYALVKSRREGQ